MCIGRCGSGNVDKVEITDTWFIEQCRAPNVWTRYAGAFDTYERARNYSDLLCSGPNYRITRYVPLIMLGS